MKILKHVILCAALLVCGFCIAYCFIKANMIDMSEEYHHDAVWYQLTAAQFGILSLYVAIAYSPGVSLLKKEETDKPTQP